MTMMRFLNVFAQNSFDQEVEQQLLLNLHLS